MICVVCGCDDFGKYRHLFFNLPTTQPYRKEWLQALKLTCMPEGGGVCANHFEPNEFRIVNGKIDLITTAVPNTSKTKELSYKFKAKLLKRAGRTAGAPRYKRNFRKTKPILKKSKPIPTSPAEPTPTTLANFTPNTPPKPGSATSESPPTTPITITPIKIPEKPSSPPAPIPFAIQYPRLSVRKVPPPPPPPNITPHIRTPPAPFAEVMLVSPATPTPIRSRSIPIQLNYKPIPIHLPAIPSTAIQRPTTVPEVIDLTNEVHCGVQHQQKSIPILLPVSRSKKKTKTPPIAQPSGRLTASTIFKPPVLLKSIGCQTTSLRPTSETQSSWYLSRSPIWHIQAVKIGENGPTAMSFNSTICRSTQTSIKDLDLNVPDKVLESLPQQTDLGRYIPLTVVVQKNNGIDLEVELHKAKRKIEKLKEMVERKNRQIKSTTAALQRRSKRVECLKQLLYDLKTKNGPMPANLCLQSEGEEESQEDSDIQTAIKVSEYSEAVSDPSVPRALNGLNVNEAQQSEEINDGVLTFNVDVSEIIVTDSCNIYNTIDDSNPQSENVENCEVIEETPTIIYSVDMPTENVIS